MTESTRAADANGEQGMTSTDPVYAERPFMGRAPSESIPARSMDPDAAYRLVRDELTLDGKPKLNCASFVTTWMDPWADALMETSRNRNLADESEYPATTEIAERCRRMVANLWNPPAGADPIATYAIGSSEAGMLAGIAMLRRWQKAHRDWKSDRPRASVPQPNLVMGRDVQVCWDKFAEYFDIEPKFIPMREGQYTITPEAVKDRVDENTIGVICTLGTTFTGEYEDVEGINRALVDVKRERGLDVPIHVDGASGGFVAPFDRPELLWDFRLEQVRSINASGHKFGLVYPGLGWVAWRDKSFLPDDLKFSLNYLGGDETTFNLNFSRPSAQVVAQYYEFLRLGHVGYSELVAAMKTAARRLQRGLLDLARERDRQPYFQALSDVDAYLPVVAIRLNPSIEPGFDVFHISHKLRQHGWIVPAYSLPRDLDGKDGNPEVDVLRMVVREGFSVDMVDKLLADYRTVLGELEDGDVPQDAHPAPVPGGVHAKFSQC